MVAGHQIGMRYTIKCGASPKINRQRLRGNMSAFIAPMVTSLNIWTSTKGRREAANRYLKDMVDKFNGKTVPKTAVPKTAVPKTAVPKLPRRDNTTTFFDNLMGGI